MINMKGSSPAIPMRVGLNLIEIELLPTDGTVAVGRLMVPPVL